MTKKEFFGSPRFEALSQYGYCLGIFNKEEEAKEFVIKYYSKNINLIRQ